MRDKLNIVFMGTPDFSVPCLHALAKSGHRVQAVFTQPDKPKGRGYKLIPTPVKAAAQAYGIPVYQPLSLRKGEDAAQALETWDSASSMSPVSSPCAICMEVTPVSVSPLRIHH